MLPTIAESPPAIAKTADTVIAWLLEKERIRAARTTDLLKRYMAHLRGAGLPIERATLHIQQLHPQLIARSILWDRSAGDAVEMGYAHSVRDDTAFLASPVRLIYKGGSMIRQRLDGPDCPDEFPILRDLRDGGHTDYVIWPVQFSGNVTNAISLASKRPGGFTDAHLSTFRATLPAFAAVLESQQIRHTSRELLRIYIGPNASERIFDGTIKRGDGQVIQSVIWLCDLRGFTELSQTEPLGQVIALLNDYFDCIAAPVVAHGGEILKFMGDAMLAIFPCALSAPAACGICDAALAAAREAVAAVESLGNSRALPLHCGVGIHVGEVMYGNIGAADRLDFTVIGPAVNLVSRIASLCTQLDHSVVVSSEVTRLSGHPFRSLGHHALHGISAPQEVFVPVDGPCASPADK